MSLHKKELAIRQKLKDDFSHYAKKCLKIRTKRDGLKPFVLNRAQRFLHEEAEKQLRERGYVRIITLKGRQQGCSTDIAGRFYWKVTHNKGAQAYILTHEIKATDNLFDMTVRYHKNMPSIVKPSTDKDSGKELHFDQLDSGYTVGTAGAKETGRSQTIQFFHGSEVAFWPKAETHARGVMQAIPIETGEVWLESTSDGDGNYFANIWKDAVLGNNDFVPVFIPWLWQEEYVVSVDSEFIIADDEQEFCDIALEQHDIVVSKEQLNFRRKKISELGGQEAFDREYPLTAEAAFSTNGVSQLIPSDKIRSALTSKLLSPPVGASILGVDVARYGDDRSVWTHRIGRYMKVLKVVKKASLTEVTGITKMILESWNYHACFIDMGMGAGVVDSLHEMGFNNVEGVNFGGEPYNKDKYPNKRNEMFGEFLEWLNDEPAVIETSDDKELNAILMEATSLRYKFDSKGRKVVESKDDMKKRTRFSNDITDSMALTFARPVVIYDQKPQHKRYVRNSKTGY